VNYRRVPATPVTAEKAEKQVVFPAHRDEPPLPLNRFLFFSGISNNLPYWKSNGSPLPFCDFRRYKYRRNRLTCCRNVSTSRFLSCMAFSRLD